MPYSTLSELLYFHGGNWSLAAGSDVRRMTPCNVDEPWISLCVEMNVLIPQGKGERELSHIHSNRLLD